jgi:methyl acetate hydrolase
MSPHIIFRPGVAFLLAAALSVAAVPRPAARQNALDAVLTAGVEQRLAPGVVAIVVDADQVLYRGAAGQMNVKGRKAMTDDAIFRIASMTKPVTAVAIMMLQEKGKLSVEDPVAQYLPAFSNVTVVDTFDARTGAYKARKPSQTLRIRHLLSNTSGFGYAFSSPMLKAMRNRTGKTTEQLPLLHEPGAQWTYGMSSKLLGRIVEKISGSGLDQFFSKQIFQPLGMKDTFYIVPAAKAGRVATVNRRNARGEFTEAANPARPGSGAAGDGGLFSTAADYAAFLRMLLNDGKAGTIPLLQPESVRAMTMNQIGGIFVQTQQTTDPVASNPFPFGAGRDTFGFGFQIAGVNEGNPDLRSPGSYSWAGSNNTHFWVDPRRRIAAVVMMQTTPFYDEGAMKLVEEFERAVGRSIATDSTGR